jgi:hypothetical protein
MPKIAFVAPPIVVFAAISSACAPVPSGGRNGVHGEFSMPAVFLTDGEVDYSDPFDPLTGEDVTDATVTAINDTTGTEVVLPWVEATGNFARGSYGGYQYDFPHWPGEEVSIRIELPEGSITGGPTVTPDSTVTLTNPTQLGTVNLPFDVTWTVSPNAYEASHVFVFMNSDLTGEAYMDVVPLNQGSYTITADMAPEPTGGHRVTVWPTNVMNLGGDAVEAAAIYVKSTELSFTHSFNIQ